jgi:hypothetical protein
VNLTNHYLVEVEHMQRFFKGNQKYLILIPVLFLIINAFFCKYAIREIENNILREKSLDIFHATEMLAIAAETSIEYERTIINSVEFLDNLHQVFAAVYKLNNGELILLNDRHFESSIFEPMDYLEFVDTIFKHDYGESIIGYTPDSQVYREMLLFFRWMPLSPSEGTKYLVVTGVSKWSISHNIPVWISAVQWASMLVTFLLNASLIITLDHIYFAYPKHESRKKLHKQ